MHRTIENTVRRSVLPALAAALIGAAHQQPLQAQLSDITFLVRRTYTTSAQIFLNPSAQSPFVRNDHSTVEGITGLASEVQVPFSDSDISLGLSVDYVSYVDEGVRSFYLGGVRRNLPFRDGFWLVPVELRGIIAIPIQSDIFRLTMAGGGGAYFAGRIYEIAGVGVKPVTTPVEYGIHISIAFEYRLVPGLWAHVETRFRDPDITVEYVFEKQTADYRGATLYFQPNPMQTRINVDGMSLAVGVMVEIPGVFHQ